MQTATKLQWETVKDECYAYAGRVSFIIQSGIDEFYLIVSEDDNELITTHPTLIAAKDAAVNYINRSNI